MPSAYPTSAELAAYIESQGLTAPDATQLGYHLSQATDEFENKTGYAPFLAAASDADWYFDPPCYGVPLALLGGFWSITEVRIAITDTDDDGTLLTELTDYLLLPINHAANNRPITEIRFIAAPGSRARSIKIVGKRGFSSDIPNDAWAAIRGRAASLAMMEITQGVSMVSEIKQGAVDIKYVEETNGKCSKWDRDFMMACRRYRYGS